MDKLKCRFCNNELEYTFVDLGLSPLANGYVSRDMLSSGQYFYPLKVLVCESCYMVQVVEFSKPEDIFSKYLYFSSFSKSWLRHCEKYVEMIVSYLNLKKESKVCEIACNDGYLLQYFKPYDIQPLGIEPAGNVAAKAREKGLNVISEFFNEKLASSLIKSFGTVDLIIGNNVVAHVPDINGFARGLAMLLGAGGCITLEFPHLLNLIKYNQFDTIYHEHYSYFSLLTISKIFKAHNLTIFKTEELNTHGGSLRIYAAHVGNKRFIPDGSVEIILDKERLYGLDKIKTYVEFNEKIKEIKRNSIEFLCGIKNQGQSIAAFGAAAKGNTFLNFCGIGRDFIDYVADSNPHKLGMYLPGTNIPIVGYEMIKQSQPDYIVILPWNLSLEIEKELRDIIKVGSKLVTFIPDIRVF